MGKLWIDSTPLEISGKRMNQGDAYIYFRGDDSFMVYQPLESIGGVWFMQKWFDFYRNKLDVRTTISCVLNPISQIDKDVKKEFIIGTYQISLDTLKAIENATYKSFNTIMPEIEKINNNINQYEYNKYHSDGNKTFVISDKIGTEIEPGTCICSKYDGLIRLNKVKIKTDMSRTYYAEEYSVVLSGDKNSSAHLLNSRFVTFNYKELPEELRDSIKHRPAEYIIPSEIYDDFEKKYIESVAEIQDIRYELLEIALENHKDMYGIDACKEAENNVYRYLRKI